MNTYLNDNLGVTLEQASHDKNFINAIHGLIYGGDTMAHAKVIRLILQLTASGLAKEHNDARDKIIREFATAGGL